MLLLLYYYIKIFLLLLFYNIKYDIHNIIITMNNIIITLLCSIFLTFSGTIANILSILFLIRSSSYIRWTQCIVAYRNIDLL